MDGSAMNGKERTSDALRLERELVWLRWLVAAFGAVQVAFTIRDRANDPSFAMPLAVALVIGLALGNVAISTAVGRRLDDAQLRAIGAAAFILDAIVISGLVWLVPSGPADPVWVVGYLIPLEGAARWGLPGGMIGGAVFLGEQVVQEAARAQLAVGSSQVAFRAGMAFVVGAVTGSFASSLRRTAEAASSQARDAAASAARAELSATQAAKAQGEVAAFHAAVLSDAQPEHLAETLRATADRVAAELGSDALGLLTRSTGTAGEDIFTAVGVQGDPGYLLGTELAPVSSPVAAAAADGTAVVAEHDVVVPMRVRGAVVGALHERFTSRAPDPAGVDALQTIADQIGVTLEATRLRAEQAAIVDRLTELDAMKTDFVAITSHELRTPLAGIRGFVDMLSRRGDDLTRAEREEYLGIVLSQTDRLIRIVDDLLVVSRIEGEALVLQPVEVDVRSVLAQVLGALGDEGGRVELDASPGAPSTLVVDPNRLIQILTNLAHNALKFSPEDARVRVRWAAPAEGTVVFEVIDQGPGIPEDEQALIFERFRQRGDHRSHSEGFGLGLYITKLLAEAMGGWLDVESAPSAGATFRVTLPASRPLPTPARPSAAARSD
ncbi:MAG: HAMP domain-containing histidine kinase [Actinomycetota bacterium]|nr:HAMP domain-containing histidine kinase [Actinomycetota bacterium]